MTGVFVDIARQYQSVMEINKNGRINYEKYLRSALNGEPLHRAIAYGVQINQEAERFMIALKNIGYMPRYKPAKLVPDENNTLYPSIAQTSWSVGMTIDVVQNLRFMDHVVLGFNSSDLIELVNYIKDQGVKVTIYSLEIDKQLKMVADNYRYISPSIYEGKDGMVKD